MTPKNQAVSQKEFADFRSMFAEKQSVMMPSLPFTYEKVPRDSFTAGRQVDYRVCRCRSVTDDDGRRECRKAFAGVGIGVIRTISARVIWNHIKYK